MERDVLGVSELPLGEMMGVEVEGHLIVLFHNPDGTFSALEDKCSHAEVKLSEGDFEEGAVTCIAHGARFDCKTGKHLCLPAVTGVKSYPVRVEGGRIFVTVPS